MSDNKPDLAKPSKADAPKATETEAAPAGTKMVRGEETVVAHKPTTVVQLKSQGFTVAEDGK